MHKLISKLSGLPFQKAFLNRGLFFVFIGMISVLTFDAFSTAAADGYVNVLTQHNDVRRTGANTNESILNPSNVNLDQFGKLYSRQVDGQIYAQPLVLSGVDIPGKGVHNVVFVATMHNSVYAFDADDNTGINADPLWHATLYNTTLGITSVPVSSFYTPDFTVEVGILSTPVIDPISRTIYVVTWTREITKVSQTRVFRLHALSVTDGSEKFGGPVVIQGAVPGIGDGNDGHGNIVFSAVQHLQRPALLLLNGIVYIAFGSHADSRPYHGWVMGYDADTLQQTSIMCTTPNGWGGAIWQAGQGPTADDDGNVYVMSGNGSVDYSNLDYSMAILKLTPSLQITDYFMPYNALSLSAKDFDLGSSGLLTLPGSDRVLGGGKDHRIYVLDTANLGQFSSIENHTIQNFLVPGAHIHGTPIWWQSTLGNLIYVWNEVGNLNSYKYSQDQFTRYSVNSIYAPPGMPGGFLSISSNSSDATTGVVWANIRIDGKTPAYGVMRAFDARTLKELWNSEMYPERDRTGLFAKFVSPTVANGRVYMSSFSNALHVFGPTLLAHTPVINPGSTQFNPSLQVSISDDQGDAELHYTLDGSNPTLASPQYTSPITITSSTTVKARAFLPGYDASMVAASVYKTGSILSLPAVADAFVRGGTYAIGNFGKGLLNVAKATSSKLPYMNKVSYLQFDLTNITSAPTSAVLKLYVDQSSVPLNSTAHISCYGLPGAAWGESTITYNNSPGLDRINVTSTGIFASSQNVLISAGPQNFDVSSFIASHLGQVVTLQLIDELPEGILLVLRSRESINFPPSLQLTW